jgi:hypothetical protein
LAQKAVYISGIYRKREPVYGLLLLEGFGQVIDLDDRGHNSI